MENIIKNSDDYVKILIITWLKIRDMYLDPKNKSVALNKKIEMLIKASKTIRKQCKKTKKGHAFYYVLKFLENEFTSGKKFLTKISHLSLAAKMFELPKPVNQLIDELGLNNIEDDEFAQAINSMLDDMDENDFKALKESKELEKTIENIQEGTLVKFMKNKNSNDDNQTITFEQEEEKNIMVDNDKILKNKQVNFKKLEKKNLSTIDEKLTMNFSEDYKNLNFNFQQPVNNNNNIQLPQNYNNFQNYYYPYSLNQNNVLSPLPSHQNKSFNFPQKQPPNIQAQTNINFQKIASQINAQASRAKMGSQYQLPQKLYSPANSLSNNSITPRYNNEFPNNTSSYNNFYLNRQTINVPQPKSNIPPQYIYNKFYQNQQRRY